MSTGDDRLPITDVDLWTWPLASEAARLRDLEGLLSEDEAERLAARKSERSRAEFVLARGRMREILAGYLEAGPDSLVFDVGPQGKPTLRDEALHFNLSHAGGHAVLAVAADRELGVDIEAARPVERGLAHRFFSEAENGALENLHNEAWQHAFFRIWTGKEAVIKATGDGMSLALSSFDVPPGPDHGRLRVTPVAPPRREIEMTYHRFAAGPGLFGCVAVVGARSIRLKQMD